MTVRMSAYRRSFLRAFRHTSIYVRKDRIKVPADLRGAQNSPGRNISSPANVWARALLADEHGVAPSDPIWVRGGLEEPGRPEKISLTLPTSIRLEAAPAGASLSNIL